MTSEKGPPLLLGEDFQIVDSGEAPYMVYAAVLSSVKAPLGCVVRKTCRSDEYRLAPWYRKNITPRFRHILPMISFGAGCTMGLLQRKPMQCLGAHVCQAGHR